MVLQIAAFVLLTAFSSFFQKKAPSKVEWLVETEYDFGEIPQHEPVRYSFTFKNISDQPLIIENVRTSCGCTGTTWSQEPVPVDSVGSVVLEYDAALTGEFRKYARVFFNGQRKAEKLWVSGFVFVE